MLLGVWRLLYAVRVMLLNAGCRVCLLAPVCRHMTLCEACLGQPKVGKKENNETGKQKGKQDE